MQLTILALKNFSLNQKHLVEPSLNRPIVPALNSASITTASNHGMAEFEQIDRSVRLAVCQ